MNASELAQGPATFILREEIEHVGFKYALPGSRHHPPPIGRVDPRDGSPFGDMPLLRLPPRDYPLASRR